MCIRDRAYVSTDANPLTDAAALMAITMITQYLPKAVANGTYMKARDKMAYGQYLAGIAFNNASLGYVHAMAHQLGGSASATRSCFLMWRNST